MAAASSTALRSLTPLWTRLLTCWPEKIAVCLGLALGICGPYFGLQHLPGRTPRLVPETVLDLAIGFSPGWIVVYLSVGLLVPLAPLLAVDRVALRRYAIGLTWLCVPCFALFWLAPVVGPRPEVAASNLLYDLIVTLDRPTNSMPSLHAGLAVYSLLYADRVLRPAWDARTRLAWNLAGWSWGLAILYSTLATKQHWALDLPAGMGIAAAAHAIAWRRRG